jgi:S1-C subfamily serine protease
MTANPMRCPACRAVLKRNPALAPGTKVKCPKCGEPFVPDETPTAIQAKSGPPPLPTMRTGKAAEEENRSRPRKARRADDDDNDRPARRPRKPQAQTGGLVLGLVGGGMFLLLLLSCGAGGLYWFLPTGRAEVRPAVAAADAAPPVVAQVANAAPNPVPVVNNLPPAVQQNPAAVGGVDAIPIPTMQEIKRATVYVKVDAGQQSGSGSGFLMKVDGATGYIVTNAHVILPLSPKQEEPEDDPPGIGPQFGPKFGPPLPPLPQPPKMFRPPGFAGPPGFGPPGFAPPGFGPPGFGRMRPAQAAPAVKPNVTVVLHSGTPQEQPVPAEVVAYDIDSDLAALKITNVANLPRPIDLGQQPQLVETMPLYIFGFPFGKALAVGQGNPAVTIGRGTVSSLRLDDHKELALVQIDGDLNPGNSGGPVVDAQGRLVGVSVAKIKNTQIGLAVPAADLVSMLKGRAFGMIVFKKKVQPAHVDLDGDVWLFDRGNKVAGGRTVSLRLTGVKEVQDDRGGEFDVDVRLTDPLNRIRAMAVHYARATGAIQAVPPNARGHWEPLAGAQRVDLTIEGQRAFGGISLPPGGQANDLYACQLSFTNADGQVLYTQPRYVRLTFAPAPRVAVGGGVQDSVTLLIGNVPNNEAARKHILGLIAKQFDGVQHHLTSSPTPAGMNVIATPVPDPLAFAAKIAFGQVTNVNGRILTVVANPVTLPPPDTNEVTQALADLNAAPDMFRRKAALERLSAVSQPIADRRAEVARALLTPTPSYGRRRCAPWRSGARRRSCRPSPPRSGARTSSPAARRWRP